MEKIKPNKLRDTKIFREQAFQFRCAEQMDTQGETPPVIQQNFKPISRGIVFKRCGLFD